MSNQILSTTQPPKTTVYKTLDAWRGFAALWVVMIHACLPTIAKYPEIAQVPLYAFSLLGSLGVQIFFVISGYCIANAAIRSRSQNNPLVYFFLNRVRRLYPPYLITSFLTIAISVCMSALVVRGVFPNSNLANLDFFHHDIWYYFSVLTLTQVPLGQKTILIVFWTLCYEVAFYVIVALFLHATRHAVSTNLLLDSLNAFTLVCLGWLITSPTTCLFPLNLWPQFGLGILVFNLILQPKRRTTKLFFALSVLLMLFYGTLHNYGATLDKPSIQVQSYFTAIYAIVLLSLYRFDEKLMLSRCVQFLAWIGIFSYSLYLTHLIPLAFMSQLGKKLGFTVAIYWIWFWLQIALALVVAYIFFLFFERPFLKTFNLKDRVVKTLKKL